MGQRLLEINAEWVADILTGFAAGGPRYFCVTRDALPADVRVVSMRPVNRLGMEGPPGSSDNIEVLLESSHWPDGEPYSRVEPQLTVVHLEK